MRTVTLLLAVLLVIGRVTNAGAPLLGGSLPLPLPLFPSDNWWNLDISDAPVDANSGSYIAFINSGSVKRLHPDFGGDVSPGSPEIYGFPYIVVDGDQPRKAVEFQYPAESDGIDPATGRGIPFYPIPDEAITQPHWIESGPPGNVDMRNRADRHMLIVDRDNRLLYELYNVCHDGTRWHAGSGALFDLKSTSRRPEGWTSADAAGLAILPGLVRYDEVFGTDEIRHAFRFTVRATNGNVYPASHRAGSNPQALPMGARLRLKKSFDISGFRPEMQKIFRAMQKYGLIVADNGSDMYVSGTYDTRWNNDMLNPAFRAVSASDFEVISLGYQPVQTTWFPYIVVGGGYSTVFSLLNTGSGIAAGNLFLTDRSGIPLPVVMAANGAQVRAHAGEVRNEAPVPISISAGASQTLRSAALDEASQALSGWARLETTGGSVAGVATFEWIEGGTLRAVAGVLGSQPVVSAKIPIENDDSQARFTGFAVGNPGDEPIRIRLTILDQNGGLREELLPRVLNPLAARNHVAAFLHEYAASTRSFRGSLSLTVEGSGKFIATALVQAQGKLTAVPVVQ